MDYPLAIFHIASEHGPFIVDVPIKDVDFPVCYVGLPEGIDGIDHAQGYLLRSFKDRKLIGPSARGPGS